MSRWLAGAVIAWAAGCAGGEVSDSPRERMQLRRPLDAIESPLSAREDYWTATLGAYLSPAELRSYWSTPVDERFGDFGRRWLEYCLREDLLAPHRENLSPEELEAVRAAADYDSSRQALARIVGARTE